MFPSRERRSFIAASGGGGGGSLLLDSLSGTAIAAFSLRKLRSGYSGAAFKAKKITGGATQDIGFDANGDLDTAALLTFAGASSVGIDTWYDQSTNAVNTSAASNAQLYVVTSGVLNTRNSKTTAIQSNTGRYVQASNISLGGTTLSVAMCLLLKSGADRIGGFLANGDSQYYGSTTSILINYTSSSFQSARNFGNLSQAAMSLDTISSCLTLFNGTQNVSYVNNSAGTGVNNSSTFGATGAFSFGGTNDGSIPGSSELPEFIAFSTSLGSSDRAAIYASHQSYWGVA